MRIRKTPIVADLLGVGYYRLISLMRSRRLAPPAKDTSGDYIWTDADIDRARRALDRECRDGALATSEQQGEARA
jgi:hypothetical protein